MGDLSCGLAGCLSSWPGYVVAGTGVGGLRCLLVGRLTRELGDRHIGRPRGLTDRVADRGDGLRGELDRPAGRRDEGLTPGITVRVAGGSADKRDEGLCGRAIDRLGAKMVDRLRRGLGAHFVIGVA